MSRSFLKLKEWISTRIPEGATEALGSSGKRSKLRAPEEGAARSDPKQMEVGRGFPQLSIAIPGPFVKEVIVSCKSFGRFLIVNVQNLVSEV